MKNLLNYYIFNDTNVKDFNSNITYVGDTYFLSVSGHGGTNIGEKASSIVLKKIISYLDIEKTDFYLDKFKEAINFSNDYLINYAKENNLYKLIGASVGAYLVKEELLLLNGGVFAIYINNTQDVQFLLPENFKKIPQNFLGVNKKISITNTKIELKKEETVILLATSFLRFLTSEVIIKIIEDNKQLLKTDFYLRLLAQNIFNLAKNEGFASDASILLIKK